jgi:hypothetical protein
MDEGKTQPTAAHLEEEFSIFKQKKPFFLFFCCFTIFTLYTKKDKWICVCSHFPNACHPLFLTYQPTNHCVAKMCVLLLDLMFFANYFY